MGDVEVVRSDLLDRPMTQLNGHWFAGPEIDGHLSRLVIDRHRDAPTSPLQRERQPIPVRWKVRVDGVPLRRSETYGWANQFGATRTGAGTLSFATPITPRPTSPAAAFFVTAWMSGGSS